MNRTLTKMEMENPLSMKLETEGWQDQIQNSIRNSKQLSVYFPINKKKLESTIKTYPMKIPLYYLSLIQKQGDPFWKQAIPDIKELQLSSLGEDPLHEERHSPIPNLIHRYPDRVLFMISDQCAMYCRYCMRKRRTGRQFPITMDTINKGIAYIRNHGAIRDVILSGGDPLLLDDEKLDFILKKIYKIQHVEIIRIHTRIPCVLPKRITEKLAERLKQYQPIYLNTHFNHPGEITMESQKACAILADAGIPLGCQTVLLKGVNDSPLIMKHLMQKLVKIRVKPYYIHHPDPVRGTGHFRVPIKTGMDIMRHLHGHMSGLCVPRYMIDLPEGGGKVPLQPEYVMESKSNRLIVRNFQGKLFEYPET